jgi:hypothetical protein
MPMGLWDQFLNEDLPVPLDRRRSLDVECRVCGHRGVHPTSLLSAIWVGRGHLPKLSEFDFGPPTILCTVAGLCPDCGERAQYEMPCDVLHEQTGSPVARDFAKDQAHSRIMQDKADRGELD